jgi:hypothetical protein
MQDIAPKPEELEPIERASIDELRAVQLERLQWTLRHAYDNVPHYRQAFEAAGAHPDDCRTLDDLAKFPFTAKDDLRQNYPFGMFAVPRSDVVRVHASSGTTGRPDRRRLHPRRHPDLGAADGPLDPGLRRPPRDDRCTSPTGTACSPAASAPTTAPRSWAARWCRCPAA